MVDWAYGIKKLYIRVDMNSVIATGHVMRCLAIADLLQQNGIASVFLLADDNAVDIIAKKGYKYKVLNSTWNSLDGELEILVDYIRNRDNEARALLIDTYMVTEKYLSEVSKYIETIYIDDLNMMIYPVHKIICYAYYWEKFRYVERYEKAFKEKKICQVPQFYFGPRYAPLRLEFYNLTPHHIKEKIDSILIMSGGTDQYHVIDRLLEHIDVLKYQSIYIICGKYSMDFEMLKLKYSLCKNIYIYKNVENIIDYMMKSDFAISAGGTTLYELCAVGLPTISYSIADNQLDNVKKFHEEEIIEYLGDMREKDVEKNLPTVISRYTYINRTKRSKLMRKLMEVE